MSDPVTTSPPAADGAPPGPPPAASGVPPGPGAPAERGWTKLLLALAAFLVLPPLVPQFRALLPVEQTLTLFVPAIAACTLVGWWAGGRMLLAIVWVAIAVVVTTLPSPPSAFDTLARGWSLLLAGSFGLVCLFSVRRPLFARSLIALATTLVLAVVMCLVGPVKVTQASQTLRKELTRRNSASMTQANNMIQALPPEWAQATKELPGGGTFVQTLSTELDDASGAGLTVFPALLALESIAALALAWATYHRLARTRLGAPLAPLREFRFNDQLVWGLIVGLVVMLLPTLSSARGAGENLLVFFGALYAVRGLGVLSWFMAPGRLGLAVGVGFLMLFAPVLQVQLFATVAFLALGVAAVVLGLGDTWADWRNRPRPTMP